MSTADLLCIIYVTGIRNNELREKLLEISRPNIEKFDRVVDSFDQAEKQLDEMRSPAAMHGRYPTDQRKTAAEEPAAKQLPPPGGPPGSPQQRKVR